MHSHLLFLSHRYREVRWDSQILRQLDEFLFSKGNKAQLYRDQIVQVNGRIFLPAGAGANQEQEKYAIHLSRCEFAVIQRSR